MHTTWMDPWIGTSADMAEYPYSRLLNRPVRYFKFFTVGDLFVIVIGQLLVTAIFGLQAFILVFAVFFGHLFLFRLGRRPGYDVHFFKSLFRPEKYRIGGAARRVPMVKKAIYETPI
jgi:hypothetical protein